jgi:hypothetical protein
MIPNIIGAYHRQNSVQLNLKEINVNDEALKHINGDMGSPVVCTVLNYALDISDYSCAVCLDDSK